MYKSYIITQVWEYILIFLAKQRDFAVKSDRIYDRSSETVPKQFFSPCIVVSYNYKAVRHILEPVYNILRVKYHYQPLCPFIAELGENKPFFFAYAMVGY